MKSELRNERMDQVYRFEVEVEGDVLSAESFPIYDDMFKTLLGGFALQQGETVCGFVSGVGHPAGIFISTGEPFYFTPMEDLNGKICCAIVSEMAVSPRSVVISKTY